MVWRYVFGWISLGGLSGTIFVNWKNLKDILTISSGKLTWNTWRFGRWFAFSILFQQVIFFRLTTIRKEPPFWVRKDISAHQGSLVDLRPQTTKPHPKSLLATCPFCKGKGKMPVLGIADPSLSSLNCKHLEAVNVKRQAPWTSSTGNKVTSLKRNL